MEGAEQRERERWVGKIVAFIVRAGLPLAQRAEGSMDPAGCLRRCGRGLRAATLRKRCRDWSQVVRFLQAAYGISWPRTAEEFTGYLDARAAEPCGMAALHSAVQSFRYFEQAGEVPPEARLSGKPAVENLLREHALTVENRRTCPRTGPRGETFPVALLVSLELTVVDAEEATFIRAYAWVKLLKFWGALRADDLQWLSPADVVLENGVLQATLRRTKTTGPGKKRAVLELCVSPDAWVVERAWLEEGFALWERLGGARDYFVPCVAGDLTEVRNVRAKYSDLVAYTRALFGRLRVAVVVRDGSGGQAWTLSAARLLHDGVGSYWTEHSERTGVVSYAAAVGIDESGRRMLGRWALTVAEGYVRTTGAVVMGIQRRVAERMRTGHGGQEDLGEAYLLRNLGKWMSNRGYTTEEVAGQVEVLRFAGRTVGPVHGDEDWSPTEIASVAPDSGSDDEYEEVPMGHFVYTSVGAKVRRLHWAGGCGLDVRGREEQVTVLGRSLPPPSEYDFVCRKCWADGAPRAQSGSEVGTASESSSSSSSEL